ncbi:MAG: tripartite tricarboxylate transporter substrate-binding protein [Gammaproteobacteria bacterium]|nr:tripartite tricarboxylate transporter substrate-binding protein [Gammaproteobacteria bacterium]
MFHPHKMRAAVFGAAAAAAAAGLTVAATAAQAADFSGKTIEWIIPFKAGGGSDKWSRFYAPLLADALPGKPNVVVKNVPGGGSTQGANLFTEQAKPDGLTIFGSSGSTQFPYLLDDPRVRYEYADWNIVLGTPTGGVVYVSPKLGVNGAGDFKRLQSSRLVYGSQGATSLDLIPLLAFDMLGVNVKAVFGMKGRKDGRLAFQRGETTIDYQTTSSYLANVKPEADAGKAVALFSWGALDASGDLVRDPTFPDLPHFAEFYESAHGKPPAGPAFNAWKTFFAAGFSAQKMVFLPQGTSNDIIQTYSDAFAKVINAPDFADKSKKRLGVYPQAIGAQAEVLKKQATTVDAASKAWVQNWLKKFS